MNVKYKIKNFRIFSEEGVDVSLKPITLLTGCNSSGKSSLVKSLLLLSDYLGALKSDNDNGKRIDLTAHKLDFTKSPHCSLGKFSKVVNNKSEVNTVSFGIQTHSEMLGQEVYKNAPQEKRIDTEFRRAPPRIGGVRLRLLPKKCLYMNDR